MSDRAHQLLNVAASALLAGLLTGTGAYVALSARIVRLETQVAFLRDDVQDLKHAINEPHAPAPIRAHGDAGCLLTGGCP